MKISLTKKEIDIIIDNLKTRCILDDDELLEAKRWKIIEKLEKQKEVLKNE